MVNVSLQIVSFFLIYGIQALADIYNSSIMNEYAVSDKRATILSVSSMIYSIFMMIALPIWGWIGNNYGINIIFLIFALIATICLPLFAVITHVLVKRTTEKKTIII